ncbi:MAG TPA: hypothetical protein V6D47_18840 [Oscillatoriaceae cyanobacterium]
MTAMVTTWPAAQRLQVRPAIDWNAVVETAKGMRRAAGLGAMWFFTAFEFAMMLGVPGLFPAIRLGTIDPFVAKVLYAMASESHLFLLPPVCCFLAYAGFSEMEHWACGRRVEA